MSYFNYHAKIKKLLDDGQLTAYEYVDNWNGIKPALVLHFVNHKSMPIREHRFAQYQELLKNYEI